VSNNDESPTVDGLVINTSLILRAIRYYAVIGAGLGLLGVILLLQFGEGAGSSGGLLGGILLLVVLSFAVLSGPLIAAFIGYVTAESGSGGIKQRSMNSGIANAIGFAIFGIIVALILSAGLAFVIGGGGDNVASSGGGGTFELGNLITLIILMTIPNALVGGTITFFTEGQDKPRHSSSSTAEGAKTQENSGWERPNRSVIAILAVTVILMMSGGAVASGFVSPSNIIDGGEPSSSPDSGGTTNPPSEDESSSSPDSDGTTNPPSEDESSSSPDSGGTTDSTLDYPSTIQGEIRPDGPRDPEYGDLTATHSIQGDAGDSIEVTIQSTEFDTYLLVTGPAGEVVAEDDDDGDNTNSRAIFTLPSDGDYTIWVGSYSGDATGRYTLSVS
jgi:hypothetical protein